MPIEPWSVCKVAGVRPVDAGQKDFVVLPIGIRLPGQPVTIRRDRRTPVQVSVVGEKDRFRPLPVTVETNQSDFPRSKEGVFLVHEDEPVSERHSVSRPHVDLVTVRPPPHTLCSPITAVVMVDKLVAGKGEIDVVKGAAWLLRKYLVITAENIDLNEPGSPCVLQRRLSTRLGTSRRPKAPPTLLTFRVPLA